MSVRKDGTFLNTGYWSSNTWTTYADVTTLQALDTLGTFRFQYNYPAPAGNKVNGEPYRTPPTQVELPDGYLMANNLDRNGPNRYVDAGLLRLDRRGRIRRAHYSNATYSDFLTSIRPLPDGSYLATGQKIGAGANTDMYFGQDHLLWRVRPSGELLDSVVFGINGFHERARACRPTPDGGYILAGVVNQPNAPWAQRGEQGEITKLDSAFQVQWTRRVYGSDDAPSTLFACNLVDVYPVAGGGYVAMGNRWQAYPQWGDAVYRAVVLELDAAGQVLWQQVYRPPVGPLNIECEKGSGFTDWVYEPDGSAVLLGTSGWEQPRTVAHKSNWLLKLTGLPAPWVPDLCARPPAAPALLAPAQEVAPRTYAYRADSTTAAGPRYAELSLCTWEWGDGSPLDMGWVAQHYFSVATPVRVRQCVVNNLFCQTCTDHFPLGPVGLADELAARVSVFPNPSASGHFTLRTEAGGPETRATFAVFDAVGRRVAVGALTGPETGLDLRAQPAGVYGLRLQWPDGRAVSKRLVRW